MKPAREEALQFLLPCPVVHVQNDFMYFIYQCNAINVKYKEGRVSETVWVIDRFSLCLMDIGGIPRNHLRLVRISFLIENLNHVKEKFVKS